ncbi:MAG: hypothetical protein NC120_00205 [Ruminococcus sp.]|nr:hypothetical protein [Ruminococcus sp.]
MQSRNSRYSNILGFGDITDTDEITFEAVIGEWTSEGKLVYSSYVDLTYTCGGKSVSSDHRHHIYLKFNGIGWYVLSEY